MQHLDQATNADAHPGRISPEALRSGEWSASAVSFHDKPAKRRTEHLDPVKHAARHYELMAAQAAATQAHGEYLKDEFTKALAGDANRFVSTPGFDEKQMPVWQVLQDLFASAQGDEIVHGMVTLLGQRLKAGDPLARHITEMAADEHAGIHKGDQ